MGRHYGKAFPEHSEAVSSSFESGDYCEFTEDVLRPWCGQKAPGYCHIGRVGGGVADEEHGLRTSSYDPHIPGPSFSVWETSYLMDCDGKLSSTAKTVSGLVAMICGSSVW